MRICLIGLINSIPIDSTLDQLYTEIKKNKLFNNKEKINNLFTLINENKINEFELEINKQLIEKINKIRKENNLKFFKLNHQLIKASKFQCYYMNIIDKLTTDGPAQFDTFDNRSKKFNYDAQSIYEFIYYNPNNKKETVNFKNSNLLKIILDSRFDDFGAYQFNDYIIQLFAFNDQ